jgi:hypothetical protein
MDIIIGILILLQGENTGSGLFKWKEDQKVLQGM